jgi:hypothetical protein
MSHTSLKMKIKNAKNTFIALRVLLYWHDLNDIFVSKFTFENNCIFTKTKVATPSCKVDLWRFLAFMFTLFAENKGISS